MPTKKQRAKKRATKTKTKGLNIVAKKKTPPKKIEPDVEPPEPDPEPIDADVPD